MSRARSLLPIWSYAQTHFEQLPVSTPFSAEEEQVEVEGLLSQL